MERKIRTIAAILTMLIMIGMIAGTAAAESVIITTNNDALYIVNNVIQVPVGEDAYDSIGLRAVYTGFSAGNSYRICVDNGNQYLDPSGGGFGTLSGAQPQIIPIRWVPTAGDINTYSISAIGFGQDEVTHDPLFAHACEPAAPVPELSTIALMSAGLLGLVGLVRRQRKD